MTASVELAGSEACASRARDRKKKRRPATTRMPAAASTARGPANRQPAVAVLADAATAESSTPGDEIDRCNKAVTEAGQRLDVPWRIRIVSERGPELLDGVIHPLLEVDVDVGSPELLVNRLSRDELTRMRHEDPQQLEGLWSEPDRALSFAELKAGGVEVEDTETEKPVVTQAGSSP